jgi:integrase
MSACRYLVKPKGSDIYCFRIRIPRDLQGLLGRTELRHSVRTSDPTIAQCRALILGRNVRMLLDLMKRKLKLKPESRRMFTSLLQQCLQKWLAEAEEDRAMRTRPLTEEELENQLDSLSYLETDAREDLALCEYRRVSSYVDDLLAENGIQDIEKDSQTYRNLCRGLLRTHIKFLEIEQRRAVGYYEPSAECSQDHSTEKQIRPDIKPLVLTSCSPTLSEVIKNYSEEQQRGNRWTAKTAGETQASFTLLLEIVGNVPVNTIPNLRDFKNKLLTLPPNYRKSPKFRDKSLTELLALAEAGKIEKTLSVITINKHLTRATSLFKWAVNNGYMERNLAEGLQIATTKRDDEYRAVFKDDDLKKLFHSRDYFKDTHRHGYRFWLPAIALFTGARLTELCQLYLEDIYEVNPESDSESRIYVIDINDKGDKKLKSPKASRRIVPLHDFLVKDLNLPGYVEKLRSQGQTRLFPELKRRKEGYGKTASKWFGEYRQRCGFKLARKSAQDAERKDFHSFRHTVTNALKQIGVEQTVISELIGHSSGSITFGRYGKRYSPKVVKEQAIDRLSYGIDLNHLKQSRFICQSKNGLVSK